MGRPASSYLDFDFGLVVFSEIDGDGFIGVQTDAYGEKKASPAVFELHHTYGFASRPLDPDTDDEGNPTNGCTVLQGWEGDEGHAWLGSDPRVRAFLPEIKKGESFQYGAKGQFVRCHEDGSISLYTTHDATPTGRTIAVTLSPSGGLDYSSPWGVLRHGPFGFTMRHSGGARIDAGAVAGLPAPLGSFGSYINLSAGIVRIRGGAIALGTDGGVASEVALAALEAFCDAVGASVAASTDPGMAPTKAAVAAALVALKLVIQNIGKVV